MRETSSNLRGAPSGLDLPTTIRPLKYTLSQISSVRSQTVSPHCNHALD